MTDERDKGALLRELRLERGQRDEPVPGKWGARRLAVVAVALCLIVAGVVAYLLIRGRGVEVQAATAIAPTASDRTASSVLQATGYVTARREATVAAQITGALTQVLIEEGERVTAGQILARLDDTAQQAALAQAQAQLAASQALLTQYQAQLDQAHRDLTRAQALVSVDAVSRQEAEQAQTQVNTLDAQIVGQQRQIDLARAQATGARVQLNYTVIRAPFSGVIIAKAAQAGEIISPISAGGGFTRTGVGTIVDMDSLEIEVDVNEAYLNRVLANQPVQAVLDAYPNWVIPAHVIAIIPTADRSKATVKVRIGIDRKDPRILPDMGVSVSFLEQGEQPGAVAAATATGVFVPRSAVVQRDGRSVVFVIEGTHARQQAVRADAPSGELRAVEGIDAGAQVVRQPPPGLHDGATIVLQK
jgi:RND family efflux transporter MFP subunit